MANRIRLKKNNIESFVDAFYPIGSVYITFNTANPSTFFGGTWEKIQGKFLLGTDSTQGWTLGTTGGEKTHTLTVNEMPSHTHNVLSGAGGNYTFVASPPEYTPSGGNSRYYFKYQGVTSELNVGGAGLVNNSYTGGGATHNNMPPYIAVYMWRRIS